MKEIKLANNKGIALVDDEDYTILSKFKWRLCDNNYALNHFIANGKQKNELMHRIIMNPQENMEIDHKDGNGLNNQKNNLRIVTKSQNCINRNKYKNSSSKYKGVYWRRDLNKWHSQIRKNKKQIYLGIYIKEIDAAKAYNKAAIELFGEYALLNEV